MDATINSENEYSIEKIAHFKIADGDLLVFETDCQINGEFVYAMVIYTNIDNNPQTTFGNLRQTIDFIGMHSIIEIKLDSKNLFNFSKN